MPITFNFIPADIRVPGVYVEYDSSKALRGNPAIPLKLVLIGQKLAAGTAPANVPLRINSADEGIAGFGRGSLGALAVAALKAANSRNECWIVPVDDVGGGTQAAGTLTFTGPATAAGTAALMIAGTRVAVGVAAAATAATVATSAAAAVNALADLPVTAAAVGAVVTLTARNKGTAGNDIDLRHSHYDGEALPAGLALAIAAMAGGATDADLAAAWAALGDQPYDMALLPFGDTATLNAANAEMERRAGPLVAQDSMAVGGYRGTLGAALAAGAARNDKWISRVPAKASPTHPAAFAAAYYATVALHASIDPARGFETLALPGVIAPKGPDLFRANERDQLLRDGMSTFTADTSGTVLIERPIMHYQVNAQSLEDPSWLDINVPLLLSQLRKSFRARRSTRFARHKLADNGAQFGPGQSVVTPGALAADNVGWYREMQERGWVDDIAGFKSEMIVERDAADRSRTNELLPVRLIGQFRIQAAKIEYRL